MRARQAQRVGVASTWLGVGEAQAKVSVHFVMSHIADSHRTFKFYLILSEKRKKQKKHWMEFFHFQGVD